VADTADHIAVQMHDAGAAGGIAGRLTRLAIVAETPGAIAEQFSVPLGGAAATA
jgi:hypothetical protein